jgi:hypothetical protein
MYTEYKTISQDLHYYDTVDYIGQKLTEEALQGWEYVDTITRPGTYNNISNDGNIYIYLLLGRTKVSQILYKKTK